MSEQSPAYNSVESAKDRIFGAELDILKALKNFEEYPLPQSIRLAEAVILLSKALALLESLKEK